MTTDRDEIEALRQRLHAIDVEREQLVARLRDLELARVRVAQDEHGPGAHAPATAPTVTNTSPAADKIVLFRGLFAGRTDVFPFRWENAKTGRSGYAPACANEWLRGVCGKPHVKCGECPNPAFIPVSDEVIECHLRGEDRVRPSGHGGDLVIGVYPLLFDDTCKFLAVDFDGEQSSTDALAFMATCHEVDAPAALERSRSGQGGHVWLFFAEPIAASEARRLGTMLLTQTMNRRPEIGFKSYDRLFPSQDTRPSGGFGNLIALPLQRLARENGNSVFVDADLQPYPDQWAFLSELRRLTAADVAGLIARIEADMPGGATGVRLPVEDEDADQPWTMSPSRRRRHTIVREALPERVDIVVADQVYVDRAGLPSSVVAQLLRVAAFQNPEFYRAQAMRLPTYTKPRIISCAELLPRHIGLPRGCLDEAVELLKSYGAEVCIQDERRVGHPLEVEFLGALKDAQTAAVAAIEPHDCGVLAATTAFGKTVVGAKMIAMRGVNTLVLVHRRQLVDQWCERLRSFLSVGDRDIGTIGGGKRRPSGRIDVALIQSLVRNGDASDLVADYGHLIVDECHHLSAVSFELVARRSKARYVLGLSATVARKDEHHPIIFMQCGPVRYRVDAKSQAAMRSFSHRVRLRETGFRLKTEGDTPGPNQIAALYAALAQDEQRNDLIFDDVLLSLEAGRRPVLLTERRDHLDYLRARFEKFTRNLVVLYGGMSATERRAAQVGLTRPDTDERLVLATGRYLGEGFDDASLDTLFLTMPISWKGTLAQYVGYQVAAVKIAAHHLNKRGGVLIGDVVGLGKTLMATALAKVFQDDHFTETLILCPKNLVAMWEDYVAEYRLLAKVLPLTCVVHELPDLRRFRIVLIDESQNLRNREGRRYRAIQEYIQQNESRCILLSATPYNKTYVDLSNQLRLFVPEDKDIGVRPERLLRELGETEFIRRHQCPVRSLAAFEKSDYADDWRELMRLYMVRRTRSFIQENYAEVDPTSGRSFLTFEDGTRSYFPQRVPKTIGFRVDDRDASDQYAQLYGPDVVTAINTLNLPRYGLGNYVAAKSHEPPTTAEANLLKDLSRAGKRLMGFCRTNLFKRLESGGEAFQQSIVRHILRNHIYLHAIENDLPLPIGTQDAPFQQATGVS